MERSALCIQRSACLNYFYNVHTAIRLVVDAGKGRYALDQPYVAANYAVMPDGGVAAQDGGAGIDHYMLLNGRVALAPGHALVYAKRAQGYALVQLYMRSYYRG